MSLKKRLEKLEQEITPKIEYVTWNLPGGRVVTLVKSQNVAESLLRAHGEMELEKEKVQ